LSGLLSPNIVLSVMTVSGAEPEGQEVFLDVVEYQFSCNAVSE